MHTYFYILLLTTNCWTKKENFSKCTKCCHYANFDKSLCAPAPVYVYFSQNCILITIHYSLCTMNEGHLPGSRVVSNLIRLTIQAYKLLISEWKCALSALFYVILLYLCFSHFLNTRKNWLSLLKIRPKLKLGNKWLHARNWHF